MNASPGRGPAMRTAGTLAGVLLVALYLFAWSNHFNNGFHFDDGHTILQNVFVRDLSHPWRYLSDTATESARPQNRRWCPLVTLTLAVDYAIAGGYKPFWFQLSTFIWFTAQLLLMGWLFVIILRRSGASPANALGIAALAAGCYGVHPAMAETVNYIIQRAEVLSTVGAVAGLGIYAGFPAQRRYGFYLIPVAVAFLAKPLVMVFPLLLGGYVALFEEQATPGMFGRVLRSAMPSAVVAVVLSAITWLMTPREFVAGATSASGYLLTQPYVAFRYFVSFFLPLHLSADSDLGPATGLFTLETLGGFAFLAAVACGIWAAARDSRTRPIAFGLGWFVVALLPTSLLPLGEVENDHRMFFPFVGLTLAVVWAGALPFLGRPLGRPARIAITCGLACVLMLFAAGTRRRNQLWHSDESLWQDVTLKSPRNGRGLMNYGLTQMTKGNTRRALAYFERAQEFVPNFDLLEINIAIADATLDRGGEAEAHFRRALALEPRHVEPHYYFGRWLRQRGRLPEAIEELRAAVAINPVHLDSRLELLECYEFAGRFDDLRSLARDSARLAPADPAVRRYLAFVPGAPRAALAVGTLTPEQWLGMSLARYESGDFQGCVDGARSALKLRPSYAEAWNNVSAGYMAMKKWDEAIKAGEEALRIDPSLQIARNNVKYCEARRTAARR